MSSAAADQLESFPFVRDITPLDFIHLPKGRFSTIKHDSILTHLHHTGLFEALPKPCNMKRSAASAGYVLVTPRFSKSDRFNSPIWPPVLTNVLLNGAHLVIGRIRTINEPPQAFSLFTISPIWSENRVWTNITIGQSLIPFHDISAQSS